MIAKNNLLIKTEITATVSSTEPQREIWSSSLMGTEASCAFNQSISIFLKGDVDINLFHQAISILVSRHEALRMSFDDKGIQIFIHKQIPIAIPFIDISKDKEHAEALIDKILSDEMTTPFNLTKCPIWRFKIIKTGNNLHTILLTLHHIICDGWSLNVIKNDLRFIYGELKNNHNVSIDAISKFSDYADTVASQINTKKYIDDEAFWTAQFSSGSPALELPYNFPRPPIRSYNASCINRTIDVKLISQLKKLSYSTGNSLFSVLFAAYCVLIRKLSGNGIVVIGIPVAGQPLFDQDKLIGHCVNFLPIKQDVNLNLPFDNFLESVSDSLFNAQDHGLFTLGSILKKLKLVRDPGRIPLVSLCFNYNSLSDKEQEPFYDLETSYFYNTKKYETFELNANFTYTATSEKLDLQFYFNTNLFSSATIERFYSYYVSILTSIVENPSYIVGKIPLMSQNERHKIISDWNDTTTDLPYNTTLDKLFKEQVVRTPNAMAVIFENESLSYNELDIWSNSIAESLINNGVTTGALVAICAERSLEMVAGLWGILKAGSAYIPIDPDYPSARIEYIIKDSQTPLILIQKTLIGKVGLHDTVKILPIEEYQNIKPKLLTLKTNITPDNIAYVIYTSGSTGKPKGVMIQHKGICNRLLWMQKEFKISNSDKIVQKTPYTFDVSVWEFFWPLITGATLVMARPGGHKDAAYLAEIIKKEKITVVHFVPSMLNYFVEEKNAPLCKNLRYVICSGETLTKGHQENFFRRMPEHIRLYNLYGPTEASVDVSFWECKRNDSHYIVPIGKPIDNIQLYILDEFMQPVPTGVYGHLYIGGVGLAKGYLNLNQLTEANFIHNPFADNSGSDRIYKTGDIARWLEDGSIEYSGRLDFQIKIRGFRIEPGEIEECISKIVNVVECTVIVKEKQHIGKYIVAFVVASGLNSQGIRSLLQNQLPEYMIPSYFVFIDNMPQTSSGKVDRKALALYDIKRDTAVNDTIIKPKNETEQIIAEIWKEKIGVSSISVVDNFFDIGGHSLLLAEINIILKQKFSASISMVTMFQYPTIASLAEYIDNKNATEHTPLNNIYNRADLQRKYLQKNSKKNNNAI